MVEKVALLAEGVGKKDYNSLRGVLTTSFPRTGSQTVAFGEEFKNIIDAEILLRDTLKKFSKNYGGFSAEEIAKSARRTAALLRLIYEALTRYQKDFSEWKAQRELCEFNDIAHAAYHLLVDADGNPTELARAVSAEYDAVYIDEYQDVNALQDATFAAISTERNRFMVGDIKQSIYRFLIQDNLFPTFAATNAIIRPRQAARVSMLLLVTMLTMARMHSSLSILQRRMRSIC